MVTLKSRFRILPILLISILSIFPFLALYIYSISPKESLAFPLVVFIIVAYLWLALVRTRVHKVIIEKNNITVKRYYGLGRSIVYDFSKLDGFVVLFESGRLGVSESLFILEKGKRVVCVCSYYISNFNNLKLFLKENLTDLGEIKGHDDIS
ncbi:hypothetical protein B0A67_24075 [Flavobacterium aquidurense]|jgi:hypothetical protein|uniref:hypothetical protein n=1 Tax=Flavobacterium aquidurense TaxID=362413 RepID=UPI0009169C13|nr:hypothetical protein [Flavobacterium aquidurense]OXA65590.1 hypothetical protein B0A67_24075 [Flavobacterium aquidurense]SHH08174.1 hypothetical protein SAMN05444481_11151 [Flavobacterium frigidimaris]